MLAITKRFKLVLYFAILTAIPLCFKPVYAQTAEHADHEVAHQGKRSHWPGLYNGFFPCADCIGIKTSLALNANDTYVTITQYVGKSPREYTEKGKFTWSEKGDIIILTSRDGSNTKRYLVGEDALVEVDEHGKHISESNILRRVDVTGKEAKHGH